ncbi:MAG TPA: LuxR C-terminal-related transcriptional regulator [Anaerolineaceae bacterium]|nr:LuxR C-terminal-related transcriptional regulator [Anaerolineaceae bacterium]
MPRARLLQHLNEGFSSGHKLTLISAPAGFGKTTLVSEWIGAYTGHVAWLSLDEGDSHPHRFMTYLISALQTVSETIGKSALAALQASEPPSTEALLTALLNDISSIQENFILVLDDYHTIDSKEVDGALTFLLDHLPPKMHLVITTREDPSLPLARMRARGQLTELRAADLRFTSSEAADFLNLVMKLNLSTEDVAALEARTEGWIAGLQLAALSMQGHQDTASFIQSFTGSHHFVLDYLIEEVLQRQPEDIQTFLLRTSILDRLCGPLCDAILLDASSSGQATLEYLQRANLFIVPLDNERRWYRYHHLFGDLLLKRMEQKSTADEIAQQHLRASQWYEDNGLIFEAFKHAVSAKNVDRAEWLMEHKEMPAYLPGVAVTILKWLESLPLSVLNSKPSLWWKQALMMLNSYQTVGVEEKLQATESALASRMPPQAEMDEWTRNLVGKIAVARAMLAQTQYQIEPSLIQARRALEYLHPKNLAYRSNATEAMGFAHYLQGDMETAKQAYTEALSLAEAARDRDGVMLATTRLAQIHELRTQLHAAVETYQRALQLIGENPIPFATVIYVGLARIYFEWNDLDTAEKYGLLSIQLSLLTEQVVDRPILSQLFMSQLKLTQGDAASAAKLLALAEQNVRQKVFTVRLPDIAAMQTQIYLSQGNIAAAAQTAQQYNIPLTQAQVLIAQGDPSAALALLEPHRQLVQEKKWPDQLLRALILQALAHHLRGDKDSARQVLGEALALAEPEGFIRIFIDKGEPMRALILDFRAWKEKQSGDRVYPYRDYVDKLLAAFAPSQTAPPSTTINAQSELIEPLSQRELEVLQLICQGLSNQEICQRLYLALDTVKGHNRRIFEKLDVHRRTEAIARARELNLF